MKKTKDLAIIFKKIIDANKNIEFIPIKMVEGIYNRKEKCFIDKDGTPYYHIIENPDSYGYCYRDSIASYKKDYRNLSLSLIKILAIIEIKKYNYTYNLDKDTNAPIILFGKKDLSGEIKILLDNEMESFYQEKCPEFYSTYLTKEEQNETEEVQTKELNIDEIYQVLTSQIIDQEEPIKKILRVIWKQESDIINRSKGILIDGASGVGKSKIIKILSQNIDIPIYTISARNYISSISKYNGIDNIIIELVKKANFDIEKAQKGIIVIDKLEEILSSPYLSEILNTLDSILEGQNIIVSSSVGDFEFDTSNLMIIGLINSKKHNKKTIGFSDYNQDENINKLFEYFQTTIKMNELNYNSYIKILKSESGLLSSNISFLDNKGVKLKMEEPTFNELANKATKSVHGVKSLEKIIERTLSVAEFEIAQNPNLYSELIITPETTENNKAYTLVKKKI